VRVSIVPAVAVTVNTVRAGLLLGRAVIAAGCERRAVCPDRPGMIAIAKLVPVFAAVVAVASAPPTAAGAGAATLSGVVTLVTGQCADRTNCAEAVVWTGKKFVDVEFTAPNAQLRTLIARRITVSGRWRTPEFPPVPYFAGKLVAKASAITKRITVVGELGIDPLEKRAGVWSNDTAAFVAYLIVPGVYGQSYFDGKTKRHITLTRDPVQGWMVGSVKTP
jgi:hypothetical protein